MEQVKLFGFWPSPYSRRVLMALKIKGVEYEYVEEDVYTKKSEELIQYNPVHKKIPVLVHDGKPIVESLVILEYIDETWKHNPILPSDPYERAQARFWAMFFENKLEPLYKIAMMKQGEEGEKAKEEAEELLRALEKEIKGGNKLFEAKRIGLMELMGIVTAYWVPIFQQVAGKELVTKDKYPEIWAWAQRILGLSLIRENLPAKEGVIPAFQGLIAAINANNSS